MEHKIICSSIHVPLSTLPLQIKPLPIYVGSRDSAVGIATG
jgi:hypothetical protein